MIGLPLSGPQRAPQPYHLQGRRNKRRRCPRPPLRFVLVWAGFTFMLSVLYLLHHDVLQQPSTASLIGQQAYENITAPSHSRPQADELAQEAYDAEATDPALGGLAFPLNIYAPLLPNAAPITDIAVETCFPLALTPCKPRTTRTLDAELGVWVQVPRLLDAEAAASLGGANSGRGALDALFGSLESKFIFYRRSRRAGVRRVVDVQIMGEKALKEPGAGTTGVAGGQQWHLVSNALTPSFWKLKKQEASYIRFRTVGGHAQAKSQPAEPVPSAKGDEMAGIGRAEAQPKVELDAQGRPIIGQGSGWAEKEAITEVDLVYGENPPWPGFELTGQVSSGTDKHVSISLAVRRKPQPPPSMPVAPLFKPDGTFKIMQLADLHYSVGPEPCRDIEAVAQKTCKTNSTQAMFEKWLDLEKPDMVVFSGDQLNGQKTSWDEQSVITQVLKTVIDRKIPWAAIHGNHDSESGVLSRREQTILLSQMPYSLTRVGPAELHAGTGGAGNYYVHLRAPTPDATHLFSLYFLDSGTRAPAKYSMLPWKWDQWNGYDWIRADQIKWFLEKSKAVKKHLVPYKPDGGKDLGKLWPRRRGGLMHPRQDAPKPANGDKNWNADAAQGTAVRKPPALLWCHIPLPEAFSKVDRDENGREFIIGAPRQETAGAEGAQKQGGLFDAIKAQGDERDVLGVLSGHMHNNADCRRVSGIWHCLNGGSSFEGYGKPDLERRSRIIMLEKWGERVRTWHRYEKTLGKIDEATLWELKA